MYYIYTGITHPRLCEKIELDSKFAYVGSEANTSLFINMLDALSASKDKFLEDTFEKFLIDRAIFIEKSRDNKNLRDLKKVFDSFNAFYTGNKPNAFKLYLLKFEDDKVKDVIKVWKTYKEKK